MPEGRFFKVLLIFVLPNLDIVCVPVLTTTNVYVLTAPTYIPITTMCHISFI